MLDSRGVGLSIHSLSGPLSSLAERAGVRSKLRMHSSSPAFSRSVIVTTAEDTICEHIHVLELSLADISARVRDAVREQRVQRLETLEECVALACRVVFL